MISLLSLAEAADRLGVSVPTLYKLMASGELAYYQVPGRRKVAESDLEAFIASRRIPAVKETA